MADATPTNFQRSLEQPTKNTSNAQPRSAKATQLTDTVSRETSQAFKQVFERARTGQGQTPSVVAAKGEKVGVSVDGQWMGQAMLAGAGASGIGSEGTLPTLAANVALFGGDAGYVGQETGARAWAAGGSEQATMSVAELMGQVSGGGSPDAIAPTSAEVAASTAATSTSASAAVTPYSKQVVDLIERRARRVLVEGTGQDDKDQGRMMLALDDGPLAGTEVWLERNEDGWKLDARVADNSAEATFAESAEQLKTRFAEAGLGELEVVVETQSRGTV